MNAKQLLQFLSALKKNNHKDWFDTHKKEYTALREEWIAYVTDLIAGINRFDSDLGELEARKCIFRINRDVRFSNDKSPYKTNFGASINKGGKTGPRAGYYIHMEPGNCFIAGGLYMPDAPALAAVRQEIDYNADAFAALVNHKTFKKFFGPLDGEKLSRPPKGYTPDNPAIEWLKYKSFIALRKVSDAEVLQAGYAKEVLKTFEAMYPLVTFLNEAVEGA